MASSDNILVVIFLRGGCDGLNLVGPAGDEIYRTERRADTRIERDGDTPGLILKNTFADVDFRLHNKAQGLKDLYDQGHLAIVHATGLTNGTRSHFEAQDYIERGTPEDKNTPSGWIARLAAAQHIDGTSAVVSLQNSLPASLLACPQAIAVPNVRKIQLPGDGHFAAARAALLQQAYQGNSSVSVNGHRVLEMLDVLNKHVPVDDKGHPVDYVPSTAALYPDNVGDIANPLKTLAQMIKMNVGLRLATVDYGGWDTHVGQAGRFANLTDGLSRGLLAFWNDMAAYQDRLTVVAMSEFGRRLKSNDSGGTDHGHGNMMLVLGGNVNGGNIYGKWPGLATEQLDNQVDLAITTDYRTVLSELAMNRLGLQSPGLVFPKFTDYHPLGIMRA